MVPIFIPKEGEFHQVEYMYPKPEETEQVLKLFTLQRLELNTVVMGSTSRIPLRAVRAFLELTIPAFQRN